MKQQQHQSHAPKQDEERQRRPLRRAQPRRRIRCHGEVVGSPPTLGLGFEGWTVIPPSVLGCVGAVTDGVLVIDGGVGKLGGQLGGGARLELVVPGRGAGRGEIEFGPGSVGTGAGEAVEP
ncbi:MAG: hypothetical protein ACXVDD_21900 [Polyangia bacterium]